MGKTFCIIFRLRINVGIQAKTGEARALARFIEIARLVLKDAAS